MNDAFIVRGGEAVGQLGAVVHGPARGHRAAIEFLAERVAFEKFGDEEGRAAGFADVVDGENIRVI